MPPTDEVTLGEVARKLDSLAGDVKGISAQLGDYPNWRDVQRVENGLKDKISELSHRVKEIEDWQKWAQRIIIGAVITGIITAFFIFKP